MKKKKHQSLGNRHSSGQNKRNHHGPAGPSKRQHTHPDDENLKSTKAGRGYQDMNNRNLEQDYHKDLDEDKINHYDSESGFDEFDEYADEIDEEGNDQEYNSRYNDDRTEENEMEELHTDTEISLDLSEKEIPAGEAKRKRRRVDPADIARKYGPIAQTEDESQHNEVDQSRLKKATRITSEKKNPTPPAADPRKGSKTSDKNKRGNG